MELKDGGYGDVNYWLINGFGDLEIWGFGDLGIWGFVTVGL